MIRDGDDINLQDTHLLFYFILFFCNAFNKNNILSALNIVVYSRDVIYRRVAFRQMGAIKPNKYCTFTVHVVGTTDFDLISTWGVIINMKNDVYIQHGMMLDCNNSVFHT